MASLTVFAEMPDPSPLLSQTTAFTRSYMSSPPFDSSHDFTHIQRVLSLSCHIHAIESTSNPSIPYSILSIKLAALLHDVQDRKYIAPPTTPTTPLAQQKLLEFGCPEFLAQKVQDIIDHISYSTELKYPEKVTAALQKYPELGIVQDADRLDAIGAVGIGRTFTYGGAKNRGGDGGMEITLQHFDEKLLALEGMMKTGEGKKLARERTERLSVFKKWWEEENNV
ncbi:MAG: hypothetical protein Q9190_000168 [Brigantiaea leucoxantha]